MLQRRRCLDLYYEALGSQYGCKLGLEHFYGDFAIVTEVVGQVNSRHSASTELAYDAIPLSECCIQLFSCMHQATSAERRSQPDVRAQLHLYELDSCDSHGNRLVRLTRQVSCARTVGNASGASQTSGEATP